MKMCHQPDNSLARRKGKLPYINIILYLIDLLTKHSIIMVKKIHKTSKIRHALFSKNDDNIREAQMGDCH